MKFFFFSRSLVVLNYALIWNILEAQHIVVGFGVVWWVWCVWMHQRQQQQATKNIQRKKKVAVGDATYLKFPTYFCHTLHQNFQEIIKKGSFITGYD